MYNRQRLSPIRESFSMKKRDIYTLDMFLDLPPEPVSAPGGLYCRDEIAQVMSAAIRGQDRLDVVEKMSALLGHNVRPSVFNNYMSVSRPDAIPPLDTAIAFDLATGSSALAGFFAQKIGAKIVVGNEALDVELGKLERQQYECAQRIKIIKKAMEDL